ncbi:hypothetical protein [Sinimarinibacterium sp. NLF-5-8]|uniref:hypothetical protein n=1 Tax=Sinimarinibacterium sp. NLF-5-8 TaxID=2698684 RepID=UPI00137BD431|nr:hypothetical protein [Sinimarinibacterium sp. NLF-5-8]QHS10034.1 hypothetical protein GT972_07670 [Sinimarinibacterium sp. NLF-5-8]
MDLTWGVKLFASPLLIGLASLAGRRWGPTAAGLLGGLPLVGGPVIIAIWLEQGLDYTQPAVAAAPAGMWANIVGYPEYSVGSMTNPRVTCDL